MENFYSSNVFVSRHQVDFVSPKKIQLFEEYRNDTASARIFVIFIRHRHFEMISNGDIVTEIKFI